MALVTVQRSPSASSSPPSSEYGSSIHSLEEEHYNNRSLSEYYFAVKGFAVLLPKNECQQQGRRRKSAAPPADIQGHLQAMLHLLRAGDTLQMAVRLESFHAGRIRYLAVVTIIGKQDTEESCLLGVDFTTNSPSLGFVLAVLADTRINLDGDGGFSVSTAGRNHIFKPVSVQAMWSALQTLHKESAKSRDHHYYQGGLNHDWVDCYEKGVTSDQSCVNEWNVMDSLESKRPPSPDSLTNQEETQLLVRSKLKEIMMSVDIDEVTSKYIRQRLEADLNMDLFKYKSFIDEEMLIILGQMDSATEIFPHVYLGSEWNASNLEELKRNGVGFILNVTKEIDNFFPGMFDYLNIRVYDDEKTELLRHWDDTYKYINQVKEKKSKVLVHCKMGISRSASVVVAYAMKANNLSLEESIKMVRSKRSCIKPNQAFISQLKIYQGILDASRQRHNVLWRSKSETNLKNSSTSARLRRSHHVTLCSKGSFRHNADLRIPIFRTEPKREQKDALSNEDINKAFIPLSSDGDEDHLSVLLPSQSKRPKSWSPDDDAVRLLFSKPFKGAIVFRDSIQKSQSLNDQTWQAHVTVEQRDLRDPGGGGGLSDIEAIDRPVLIEAYNPLYVPRGSPPSPSSLHHLDDLQLSSSVKERINEFESAQTTGAKQSSSSCSLKSNGEKSPPPVFLAKKSPTSVILIDNVTIDTSNDFEVGESVSGSGSSSSSSTKYLDDVVDSLLAPLSAEEPKAANIKDEVDSPLSSPSIENVSLETADTVVSSEASVVIIPNESITWAAGIVKKQKEDFEEMVKVYSTMSKSCEKLKDVSDVPCTSNRLTRSASSVTAAEVNRNSTSKKTRKEDFFSTCLDKVFDREEKKQKRHSVAPDIKESPSRNSSWGSFDSAVILMDREAPSRQSSWGSCDTRFSVGSIPSRNSSLGAFDYKQSGKIDLNYDPTCVISQSQCNFASTCFDKENDSFSPATIRRNKINKENSPLVSIEGNDTRLAADSAETRVETDMPKPSVEFSNIDKIIVLNSGNFDSKSQELDCSSQIIEPLLDRVLLKHSPQSPEHEIPLPGTVKQQKEKLESKTKALFNENPPSDIKDIALPSFARSLSSGSVESSSRRFDKKNLICRSLSEKRSKCIPNPSGGKVKKITRALENQKVTLISYSSQLGKNFTRNIKDCLVARKEHSFRTRSLSLDRLSTHSSSGTSCSTTSSSEKSSAKCQSSQNLLDQLANEVQTQVDKLEGAMEEKCVKDIVDMFEEIPSAPPSDSTNIPPLPSETGKKLRRKTRPRSESIGERMLPPVPRRKSSLDHNFRSTKRLSQPTTLPPLRQSLSWSPASKTKQNVPDNPFYYCLPDRASSSSPRPPAAPPPPPQAGARSHTCSLEVRRTKQQGKTHPLTKLAQRENTL